MAFTSEFPLRPPMVGLMVSTPQGTPVFSSNPRLHIAKVPRGSRSEGGSRMRVKGLPLRAGTYHLSVWLGDWQIDYDHRLNILAFEFGDNGGDAPVAAPINAGFVEWPTTWEMVDEAPGYSALDLVPAGNADVTGVR